MDIQDLLIIGGGINGTGIARDAAGRGLSVTLVEKNDLASGTSSKSSKLIHGGLRYLEYGEFRLVREALRERETLMRIAPHLVSPLRIVLPHHKSLRPKWMLRLGLFMYDHIGGGRTLPGTAVANLRTGTGKDVLKPAFETGFVFSDCRVDDARLVVTNALAAQELGAEILVRSKCTALGHKDNIWHATISGHPDGKQRKVRAKCIVNASGIRVDQMVELALSTEHPDHLRLVKGSHIVTKRLYPGRQLYMFQNPDKRIIFAIPYEQDFTLIGTTDAPYELSDGPIEISDAETDYLLGAANQYFAKTISREDIVWSYAGVRPLYDNNKGNASAVTRDYVFDVKDDTTPPLLSIFGGKITTYRELAEHALGKLGKYFPNIDQKQWRNWTGEQVLPGGDLPESFDKFVNIQAAKYPFLSAPHLLRLCRSYGTNMDTLMSGANTASDMGQNFGGTLTEREAKYLVKYEWAKTAEDIIWRRTKCGLHMSEAQQSTFRDWF